jgi:hypothetical protein
LRLYSIETFHGVVVQLFDMNMEPFFKIQLVQWQQLINPKHLIILIGIISRASCSDSSEIGESRAFLKSPFFIIVEGGAHLFK